MNPHFDGARSDRPLSNRKLRNPPPWNPHFSSPHLRIVAVSIWTHLPAKNRIGKLPASNQPVSNRPPPSGCKVLNPATWTRWI